MKPAKGLLGTVLLLSLVFRICISFDTITLNQPIKDGGDNLVSNQKAFALGFFSPGNSNLRYVGIWYNEITEQTVVWVANRDNPLNDTSGVLSINGQGNLVLHKQNQTFPIWSTNVSVSISSSNNSKAQLLDSGNLVLVQQDNQRVIWQSFDYPTNTFLPFMKLGLDKRTGLNWYLTSWKSKDDPGTGNSSFRIDPTGFPQFFLYMGRTQLWRAGPWNGLRLSGIPEMTKDFIFNPSFVNDQDEIFIMYTITDNRIFSRMVVDESGIVERSTWHGSKWVEFWSDPKETCDNYLKCGPNSYCDPYNAVKFECTCLPGFEPKLPRDWYLRDGSGGCVRKPGVSTCNSGEGFVKLARVKVPDTSVARANMSLSLKECEKECLRNCSCMAYTSANVSMGGIGCLTWHRDLVDTRSYSNEGQDLYIRVDAAVLAQYAKKSGLIRNKKMLAILGVSIAVILVLAVSILYWFVMKRKKGRRKQPTLFNNVTASSTTCQDSRKLDESRRKPDLPVFDISTILVATKNFSPEKRLGQGGFGPVYKGQLDNGQEIAVKTLSRSSKQGTQEFMNEVMLIAKLQHRNLVRLFGCCIHKEEKMLVYEYMPNKSLDFFIFDQIRRQLLDWKKRFEIISGIARGVLYLHQDSRLKIIHRDLKASNVLLDAAMNPKISDFGLARMFGDDQIEANTNRVVGTYGYMSPEYAMEGLYSIKSDVFAFGVLTLEIISGKRNNHYHVGSPCLNLIGHVWDLWMEGKGLEIVDSLLGEAYPAHEVSRCVHIGLLCVQEQATDRPTMPEIVFMLGNETTLPPPNKPAFINRRIINSGQDSSSSARVPASINNLTISMLEAR